MLQNARVTALTVSELLRENQQAGKGGNYKITPTPHTHTHTPPHTRRLGLSKISNNKQY